MSVQNENGRMIINHPDQDNVRKAYENITRAAPDLLDACYAARSLLRGSGFPDITKALMKLESAILKAETGK